MEAIQRILPANCFGKIGGLKAEGLVVHHLSGIDAWKIFSDLKRGEYDPFDPDLCWRILAHYGYSAHYFVDRDGNLYQWVPLDSPAWHAGASILNGRRSCNFWTIGLEIASTGKPYGGEPAYTDASLLTAQMVVAWCMADYKFGLQFVGRHDWIRKAAIDAGIAKPEDVKHDPGPLFPWEQFLAPLSHVVAA